MSARSIPITLAGKDYEMMFEPEDVEALESEMMMGYIFFFRVEDRIPLYLSFRQERAFIHHGLRTADTRGDLHYVFPQTPTGSHEAGDLVKASMQKDGRTLLTIWETARDAFNLDWFEQTQEPVSVPEKKISKKEIMPSKNLRRTG